MSTPVSNRRRRWPWVLLILLVLVAALVIAAEFIARSMLPGVVRGVVIEKLDLPADQQLDVDAEGFLLPQLIGGRLDDLHLSTDDVTIGGLSGAADVTAHGVPLRGGDMDAADGTIRIDQEQLSELLANSELAFDSLELDEPDVTIGGAFPLFGTQVPYAFTGTPSAESGDLVITPVRVLIGGLEIDAGDVAGRFGDVGAQLTGPQRICIADRLPAGVTLTGLAVDGTEAVIDLDVEGAIVTDAALRENGVCD